MRISRSAAIIPVLALAGLALASCGGLECPNCPGGPAEVRVSPGATSVLPGRTLQLAALVLDSKGHLLSGQAATWGSSNPAFATVDANGLVTGLTEGAVTITADVGSLSNTGNVSVVTNSTFSAQVFPILRTTCATAFCHVSPGPAPNMSSQAAAFTALSDTLYTMPGDTTVGRLLGRLRDNANPMPPGGAFAVRERGNYDLIALWIAQGRLNN